MALIAEEVVEEWLNQQGYFTIRGVKLGVHEMDILAIKPGPGKVDLRHYEVQSSVNPTSYISSVPKEIQRKEGRKPNSAKTRPTEELSVGVSEWIDNKFLLPKKRKLRNDLVKGSWSFHFVVNEVRHPEELEIFEKSKQISVIRLGSIVEDLKSGPEKDFTASGKDLIDLMKVIDRDGPCEDR